MVEESPTDFVRLLDILVRGDVDFVIVGGVAALLAGSPIPTMDLDILYEASRENIERLLGVLQEIHAVYRDPAGRRIFPDVEKLATLRLNLLQTDLGALDVLPTVGAGLAYADLIERTEEYEISGFTVRALNVEALIETKEHAGRSKDKHALLFLKEILEMRR